MRYVTTTSFLFYLHKAKLNWSLTSKDLNHDLQLAFLHVDLFDDTGKSGEGTIVNLNALTKGVCNCGLFSTSLLHFIQVTEDTVHFRLSKGCWIVQTTKESQYIRDITKVVCNFAYQRRFHKYVTGQITSLLHNFLTVANLNSLLSRYQDL